MHHPHRRGASPVRKQCRGEAPHPRPVCGALQRPLERQTRAMGSPDASLGSVNTDGTAASSQRHLSRVRRTFSSVWLALAAPVSYNFLLKTGRFRGCTLGTPRPTPPLRGLLLLPMGLGTRLCPGGVTQGSPPVGGVPSGRVSVRGGESPLQSLTVESHWGGGSHPQRCSAASAGSTSAPKRPGHKLPHRRTPTAGGLLYREFSRQIFGV